MNTNWFIKACDDYHQIGSDNIYLPETTATYKTIELGGFSSKGSIYFQYYGLYYLGKKPPKRDVLKLLNQLACAEDEDGASVPILSKDINWE